MKQSFLKEIQDIAQAPHEHVVFSAGCGSTQGLEVDIFETGKLLSAAIWWKDFDIKAAYFIPYFDILCLRKKSTFRNCCLRELRHWEESRRRSIQDWVLSKSCNIWRESQSKVNTDNLYFLGRLNWNIMTGVDFAIIVYINLSQIMVQFIIICCNNSLKVIPFFEW